MSENCWDLKRKFKTRMIVRNKEIPIGDRICVMGILNVTPDSFSDGGEFFDKEAALRHALEMVRQGADIIDIGGESTRPGSERISAEEELDRIMPVLNRLRSEVEVPISIDTYKADVAQAVLQAGADIINDITALTGDEQMGPVIASFDAGVILMHMQGTPLTMQKDPKYGDVVEDIKQYLKLARDRALEYGIDGGKIILDPGIGFGKSAEDNLKILRELGRFKELGKPLLLGVSRKSFIGALTGKEPSGRLAGTISAVTVAALNGADVLRVHDTEAVIDAIKIIEGMRKT